MKKILSYCFLLCIVLANAQPANDNCSNATSLTVGANLLCNQTTNLSTLEGGECYTNYAGATEHTVWYRFSATNDSLVLNLIKTNVTNCASPHVRVWGPFANGAGCLPSCGTEIYNQLRNGDPGSHILLTGLQVTGNNQYLVQVQDVDCGGANDGQVNFCINLKWPAVNSSPPNASVLNACGTAFTGSTNGGYWNNGTGTGFNNLDNNAGTTCGGCTAGADTPFIINNISWFTFCSGVAGTWQITVNNISNCVLAAPNQGVQASVFTGTTTALVNAGNSQNPIPLGGSWTSPTISVGAGQCAWLMVDGFAGDACTYSVTLTNITGGCVVLPVQVAKFNVYNSGGMNIIEWVTESEKNNNYFTIEKSADASSWEVIARLNGNINSKAEHSYRIVDEQVKPIVNYYRLKQTDLDGKYEYFKIFAIDNRGAVLSVETVYDLLGNSYGKSIPQNQPGIFVVKYNDGSVKKVVIGN